MTRHQENHTAAAESVVEAILPPPSLWAEQCPRLSLTQFERCGNAFLPRCARGRLAGFPLVAESARQLFLLRGQCRWLCSS